MKRHFKTILILAFLAVINIRCTGTSGGSDAPPGATPMAARTYQYHTLATSELKPIEVQLLTAQSITEIGTLPTGAIYNSSTHTFRWIPKKGQAGDYNFILGVTSANVEHRLTVTVDPLTETQLKTGPLDVYEDGDVGYVFVHGAGDVDRCTDALDLEEYWGDTKNIIAPDTLRRKIVCYDGRNDAEDSALQVAQQILQADCGKYNRCVIITHSMGGLILNHILTHTRVPTLTDPKPSLFDNRFLYQQVKNRALFVISLGSSAGGSKVANIVEDPTSYGLPVSIISFIEALTGYGPSGYTRSNFVSYATRTLAPITEDTEVPFFMVAGFSERQVDEYAGGIINNAELPRLFNEDAELTSLDQIATFRSRSDGLVSFRSACGVASDVVDDGPGRLASLAQQFQYCFQAPKKANFYPWFVTNLNHYLLASPVYNCSNSTSPCRTLFANTTSQTMVEDPNFAQQNAAQVIRTKLTSNVQAYDPTYYIQF